MFATSGRVMPYARLLQLRSPNGQSMQKVSVESLGGKSGVKALPLGLVVETSLGEVDCRWRPP